MEVLLEDVETGERETIILSTDEHAALMVPSEVAHAVRAREEDSVLLVLATTHSRDEDVVVYQVGRET